LICHIERSEAKVLCMNVRIHSKFRSARTSIKIKPTPYKALIRSVMTYTYPTWDYEADANLLKLQPLQNRTLRAVGNVDSRTPVLEWHVVFKDTSP
jgi:hypothetical protein